MRKRRKCRGADVYFELRDASELTYGNNDEYGVDEYMNFTSNGMTNNEKIDSEDYYNEFLDENETEDDYAY